MKQADRLNYLLPLEPTQVSNALYEGHMTGPTENRWKPIRIPEYSNFTDIGPFEYIYAPFDYNKDDDSKLPLFKKQPNDSLFRGVDRLKLIAGIISARLDHGGSHLDVYRLIKNKAILAFFPLHDIVELKALEEKWIRFVQFPWRQKTDNVKDYYGEKIGMYFQWLGHYTTYLLPAAIIGFFAWINVAAEGVY